jgi:hypothetical protein
MFDLDYMNRSFFRLPEPILFLYTLVDYIACFKRPFEKWKCDIPPLSKGGQS